MSNNPYLQVAMTYVRRPLLSWRGSILIVCIVCVMIACCVDRNAHGSPLLLIAATFLFSMIAIHIKEQFVDSRAYLIPGFCRTHVAVATMVILFVTVFLPALLTILMGFRSIGLIAIMVLLFSVVFWFILLQSAWLSWLLIGGIFMSFANPSQEFLKLLISGQSEIAAVALLITGIAITQSGLKRLTEIDEEMPEYHLRIMTNWVDRKKVADRLAANKGLLPHRLREWLAEKQISLLVFHARHASVSWWSRVYRWHVETPTRWSVWPLFLGLLIYFLCLTWLTSMTMTAMTRSPLVAVLGTCFPVLIAWKFVWYRLNRSMYYELLMPVERSDYIKQLGVGVAISQFQLWVAANAAVIMCFLIVDEKPTLDTVTGWLVFSALSQVLQFGMAAWFLQYRSFVWLFPGTTIAIYLSWMPAMAFETRLFTMWWPVLLLISCLFAALGALLTWRAYHRWLKMDFD